MTWAPRSAPLGYGRVLGGNCGRAVFILAPGRTSAALGANLRKPGGGSASPLAAPVSQPFQAENRLLDLLSFVPQFDQDFSDIHFLGPPFRANSPDISFTRRFFSDLILARKSYIIKAIFPIFSCISPVPRTCIY